MPVAALLDRHAAAMQAFMVVGPFILGFPAFTGLFNPIWGGLTLFPLTLALAVSGYPPSSLELALIFGSVILWPLILLGLMTWLSGWLLQLESAWRVPALLAWLCSVLLLVPIEWADGFL